MSNTDWALASDVSFTEDNDQEIDKMEVEEQDWIEYNKRSTREADEQMKKAKIPCWIETHRRMKWRFAIRTASLPGQRRYQNGTQVLTIVAKTNRPMERPRKRWEDEINEFSKTEESEESEGNDMKNNDTNGYDKQRNQRCGK